MFTFEERYRPLKAGAKFVYLSSDSFFNRSRDEINEDLHIKCIGVNVQFMAEMNKFQSWKGVTSREVITTDLPMAIISYGNLLIN